MECGSPSDITGMSSEASSFIADCDSKQPFVNTYLTDSNFMYNQPIPTVQSQSIGSCPEGSSIEKNDFNGHASSTFDEEYGVTGEQLESIDNHDEVPYNFAPYNEYHHDDDLSVSDLESIGDQNLDSSIDWLDPKSSNFHVPEQPGTTMARSETYTGGYAPIINMQNVQTFTQNQLQTSTLQHSTQPVTPPHTFSQFTDHKSNFLEQQSSSNMLQIVNELTEKYLNFNLGQDTRYGNEGNKISRDRQCDHALQTMEQSQLHSRYHQVVHSKNIPILMAQETTRMPTTVDEMPTRQAEQPSMVNASGRKRIPFTYNQLEILRAHFDNNNRPRDEQIEEIAAKINRPIEQTRRWFVNERFCRAKKRAAQGELIQVNASGRKRIPFTYNQLEILRAHFDNNNRPRDEQIEEIAAKINRPIEQTRRWFVNERFCRAKKRAAQGELIQVNASGRKRIPFTYNQLKILSAHFDDNHLPGQKQMKEIAEKINRPIKQTRRWFKYQRYCEKKRAAQGEQRQVNASRRSRKHLNMEQRMILLEYFDDNDSPGQKQMEEIAKKINQSIWETRQWFISRRRYIKKKRAAQGKPEKVKN